jgi:hypothetical protein
MKRLLYSTAFLVVYVILITVVEWDLGYYPIMTFIALHLILFLIVNHFLKKKKINSQDWKGIDRRWL